MTIYRKYSKIFEKIHYILYILIVRRRLVHHSSHGNSFKRENFRDFGKLASLRMSPDEWFLLQWWMWDGVIQNNLTIDGDERITTMTYISYIVNYIRIKLKFFLGQTIKSTQTSRLDIIIDWDGEICCSLGMINLKSGDNVWSTLYKTFLLWLLIRIQDLLVKRRAIVTWFSFLYSSVTSNIRPEK